MCNRVAYGSARMGAIITGSLLHDWEHRSTAELPDKPVMAALAEPGTATPPGMIRLTAREIMEG